MPIARRAFARLAIGGNTRAEAWPQPVIFVANHRSLFDVPPGFEFFRRSGVRPRIVAHRRYVTMPAVGTVLRALGGMSVDRGGLEPWLAEALDELARGNSIALMPEGRLHRADAENILAEVRIGACELSRRSQVPVLPIGMVGTDEVWPPGRRVPFVRLRRPTVAIHVGTPLAPGEKSTGQLRDELTDALKACIADAEAIRSAAATLRQAVP